MPTVTEALQLAMQRHQAGDWATAETIYRDILAVVPQQADAWHGLGCLAQRQGNSAQAVACYRELLAVKPRAVDLLARTGAACYQLGAWEEARQAFEQALAIQPQQPELLNNLGLVYEALGSSTQAINFFSQALEVSPHQAEVHLNAGVSWMNLEEHHRALAALDQALRLDPNSQKVHIQYAYALLFQGAFSAGWREYEWRWLAPDFAPFERRPPLEATAAWCAQRSLFIFPEQGIGDEIMFLSCLPDFVRSSKQITVACEARLVPLLARSFPSVEVVAVTKVLQDAALKARLLAYDCHVPLASLPRFCRNAFADFPQRSAYLQADASRITFWKQQLASLGPELKVGISWRGGAKVGDRMNRSTSLTDWLPLLKTAGVKFINLQYGDCTEELAAAAQCGRQIQAFTECNPLQNMDDFAALISALDLVISIDNSTIHLAGALGVPTWVALSAVPGWRWLAARADSPWYASLRLFRQTKRGQWGDVFAKLQTALERLALSG